MGRVRTHRGSGLLGRILLLRAPVRTQVTLVITHPDDTDVEEVLLDMIQAWRQGAPPPGIKVEIVEGHEID